MKGFKCSAIDGKWGFGAKKRDSERRFSQNEKCNYQNETCSKIEKRERVSWIQEASGF